MPGDGSFLRLPVLFLPGVAHLLPLDLQIAQQEDDKEGYTHYGKVLHPIGLRLLSGPTPDTHNYQVDKQNAGSDIDLLHTDSITLLLSTGKDTR